MSLRQLTATEYLTPLREGGSLPAIVRADDDRLYVMKFVGAGQGAKALIAELIAGEIARSLGFRVPEIVLLALDPAIGSHEPDAEIQDLLQASAGINLGMAFLPESTSFNLLAHQPAGEFADRLVWFDAFVTNVDRTPRNVNLLYHRQDIWLIDHGASLYFQHNWQDHIRHSASPFPMIKDHVLLPLVDNLTAVDAAMKADLSTALFEGIVNEVPNDWLENEKRFSSPAAHRAGFVEYLSHRRQSSVNFVEEAQRARSSRD